MASAQVKSCVLLAGLNARRRDDAWSSGSPDPRPHRAHARGCGRARAVAARVGDASSPRSARGSREVDVPGDFSSAAPLLVAAALVPGSDLTIHDLGVNPPRTGLLDVLERMGARVAVFNRRTLGGEPVATVQVRRRELMATEIEPARCRGSSTSCRSSRSLASHARGESRVSGAEELRVKESDRIEAVTDGLQALGARIRARPTASEVTGVPAP